MQVSCAYVWVSCLKQGGPAACGPATTQIMSGMFENKKCWLYMSCVTYLRSQSIFQSSTLCSLLRTSARLSANRSILCTCCRETRHTWKPSWNFKSALIEAHISKQVWFGWWYSRDTASARPSAELCQIGLKSGSDHVVSAKGIDPQQPKRLVRCIFPHVHWQRLLLWKWKWKGLETLINASKVYIDSYKWKINPTQDAPWIGCVAFRTFSQAAAIGHAGSGAKKEEGYG